jgi:SSS family solute:Na+ symporter
VIINLVLTVVLTLLFSLLGTRSADETVAAEYQAPSRTG